MNKTLIISSLVLALLLGGVWYWGGGIERTSITTSKPKEIRWSELIPQIRGALNAEGAIIEEQGELKISEERDLTGDGVTEVVIDTGAGGASSQYFAIMRLNGEKPESVRVKDRDGKFFQLNSFPVGSSAMHGQDLSLIPDRNAISLGTYGIDGATLPIKIEECRNEIYVWKSQSQSFEWDSPLSDAATEQYCSAVQKAVDESNKSFDNQP